MRHRLLNNAPADAHAAHQTPITVDLAVLLANRLRNENEIPKLVTTCSNRHHAPSNPLIRLTPPHATSQKPAPNCSSWASGHCPGRPRAPRNFFAPARHGGDRYSDLIVTKSIPGAPPASPGSLTRPPSRR